MRARHIWVVAALAVGLTGCGGGGEEPAATATSAAAPAAVDRGIPPEPDKEAWNAYIATLKKIDPAIVGDKDEERLIDRGRDQCGSVKEWPNDQAKLVGLTNQRFTSPEHPDGFGKAKATKILAAVRKYICPSY